MSGGGHKNLLARKFYSCCLYNAIEPYLHLGRIFSAKEKFDKDINVNGFCRCVYKIVC